MLCKCSFEKNIWFFPPGSDTPGRILSSVLKFKLANDKKLTDIREFQHFEIFKRNSNVHIDWKNKAWQISNGYCRGWKGKWFGFLGVKHKIYRKSKVLLYSFDINVLDDIIVHYCVCYRRCIYRRFINQNAEMLCFLFFQLLIVNLVFHLQKLRNGLLN